MAKEQNPSTIWDKLEDNSTQLFIALAFAALGWLAWQLTQAPCSWAFMPGPRCPGMWMTNYFNAGALTTAVACFGVGAVFGTCLEKVVVNKANRRIKELEGQIVGLEGQLSSKELERQSAERGFETQLAETRERDSRLAEAMRIEEELRGRLEAAERRADEAHAQLYELARNQNPGPGGRAAADGVQETGRNTNATRRLRRTNKRSRKNPRHRSGLTSNPDHDSTEH